MSELTIRHYADEETPPSDVLAEVTAILREIARDKGLSLAADPVSSEREAVTLTEEGGYGPWAGTGFPDGYVASWTVETTPVVIDPEPLTGGTTEGDVYTVPVPADVAAIGGPVRVRHGLGGPVTVTVFSGKDPTTYLFTQPVSDDEEHVELVAGATHIMVTRDVEEE